MQTFNFTVHTTGIVQIHDALSCLARFDENIVLEANANEALLSVFRRRQTNNKENENNIEKCEFELQSHPENRLVVKLFCRPSIIKTFRLTFETADILHATFDKQASQNTWTLSARTLRDVVNYFGPKTEHVDWSLHEHNITFTSYTEKVQVGKEIIRQPAHTSVGLSKQDFDQCNIEPGVHVSIPVKDFRFIVAHADTMKSAVRVAYSQGQRPAQFTYGSGGLAAQFTLMTKGTSTAVSNASRAATPARGLSVRPVSQPPTSVRAQSGTRTTQNDTSPTRPERNGVLATRQPPAAISGEGHAREPVAHDRVGRDAQAQARSRISTSGFIETPAPSASNNPDSMFFPAAEDEDASWDPVDYADEPDMVKWDDGSFHNPSAISSRRLRDTQSFDTSFRNEREPLGSDLGLAPTQRLSQIQGLFD
ncbi:hypothetical protein LTS08_008400 [Lithohypha guttulata]|uniref:DNA repair protein rad9 n=1 Tax=Lithohypha guttulata TaxID=1690604 RepID=A0AAN7SU43_9EURO|nr:hypothetical protein LTR05_007696 [Lithohypha guttulata]KAK5094783.1 hypothetical protein LTS08_008400 [Lithohypha guttulata]